MIVCSFCVLQIIYTLLKEHSLRTWFITQLLVLSALQTRCHKEKLLPLQMQRHDLAQHMQEFTQMHMRYLAEFLRGLSLNGTAPKSLWTLGPSVSSEDQGAAASVSPCSGPRGAVSCTSNCAPCQPTAEMQRLREMDGRLVKQDHQLRELIILKDTQVKDVLELEGTNTCIWIVCVITESMITVVVSIRCSAEI